MNSYKQYSNAQCAFFDGTTQLSKQIKTFFSISLSKIYTAYTKYWILDIFLKSKNFYNKSDNVHILIICIKNDNNAAAQKDYQNHIRCVYALYILNKCKCLIIHMHFLVNTYFYIV